MRNQQSPLKRLLKIEASASRTHWPARCGVLGRARSAATSASCVLASRLPIAPWRRSVTLQQPLKAAAAIVVVLAVMLFAAGPASAASTAAFLDSEFFAPHDSPITGEMVVNNWRWYGVDVLPQLVILAAETSLGDPRLGGSLVRSNNFGCMRYHGTDSKWGELSNGRVWAAGKDWYSFPSPELGMMGFGRYLKVGLDGFYLRVLDGPSYDWPAFAARYYGRNVAGYDRYVRNLQALDSRFRAKAAAAGFLW